MSSGIRKGMSRAMKSLQTSIPSVDRVLRQAEIRGLIDSFGRQAVTGAVRDALGAVRDELAEKGEAALAETAEEALFRRVADAIDAQSAPSLKPVFNLTGTVLHTNLGRAPLPPEAIEAMARVAGGASNLEFDEVSGRRGDRDAHLEAQLCRLTGAEAATVVNNNAAAVMLVLNSLALRKEVPVSRGELIEIGGAFRIPDIMARAGAKLCEVGTTNRTHLKDFAEAIGPRTALIMKVHTSNYTILGFSAAVPEVALAGLAREHGIPFVVDLGSGMLVDMAQYGLPHETTAAETLANGADLATFSGDKLLGGPQAGIIVGRADLIERIKRNPMKRALRVDKMTIAALAAVLGLYANPDRLAERLPVLRLLRRPVGELEPLAKRLIPFIAKHLGDAFTIEPAPCQSQIGSGALPVELLDSVALVIRSRSQRGSGKALERLASAFRVLPIPVIGRVQDDSLQFDLRCLEDERGFTVQLGALSTEPGKGRRGGR